MKNDIIDDLVESWEKERPDLDPSPMHIVGRILKLGYLFENSANQALKDTGVHYTDFDVLATLRRMGKPYKLSPKALMESVLITSGAMTGLLNRLEKKGLIERIPDEFDKRSFHAQLSFKGLAVIDRVIEIRFSEASKIIDTLSPSQKNQMISLLKELMK